MPSPKKSKRPESAKKNPQNQNKFPEQNPTNKAKIPSPNFPKRTGEIDQRKRSEFPERDPNVRKRSDSQPKFDLNIAKPINSKTNPQKQGLDKYTINRNPNPQTPYLTDLVNRKQPEANLTSNRYLQGQQPPPYPASNSLYDNRSLPPDSSTKVYPRSVKDAVPTTKKYTMTSLVDSFLSSIFGSPGSDNSSASVLTSQQSFAASSLGRSSSSSDEKHRPLSSPPNWLRRYARSSADSKKRPKSAGSTLQQLQSQLPTLIHPTDPALVHSSVASVPFQALFSSKRSSAQENRENLQFGYADGNQQVFTPNATEAVSYRTGKEMPSLEHAESNEWKLSPKSTVASYRTAKEIPSVAATNKDRKLSSKSTGTGLSYRTGNEMTTKLTEDRKLSPKSTATTTYKTGTQSSPSSSFFTAR